MPGCVEVLVESRSSQPEIFSKKSLNKRFKGLNFVCNIVMKIPLLESFFNKVAGWTIGK